MPAALVATVCAEPACGPTTSIGFFVWAGSAVEVRTSAAVSALIFSAELNNLPSGVWWNSVERAERTGMARRTNGNRDGLGHTFLMRTERELLYPIKIFESLNY